MLGQRGKYLESTADECFEEGRREEEIEIDKKSAMIAICYYYSPGQSHI
jgi:hypothetical protein